jgi:hypothetical protein
VQSIANYALVAHFCFPGRMPLGAPTFGGTRAIAIAISAVALSASAACLLGAARAWRESSADRGAADDDRAGPARFMAFAAMLTSTIFTFAVAMNTLPLFGGSICTSAT